MAHPLSGADAHTLRTVIREAGGNVNATRLLKIWLSVLGREPFTALEKSRTDHVVPALEDMPAPVFILGHWRSGTTHLYNVMSLGAFGYVPPTSVGMPWNMLYLGKWIEPLLQKALPKSRYIDNIPVTPTSPQEDEIAIANMSKMSFYHGIYFPKHFDRLIDRGLFFDGADPSDINSWRHMFGLFLRKLHAQQDRPLLIKNPVYTARPALLKDMFPGAKFVHIHRNPFDVFLSMRNFWTQLLGVMALQPYEHVDVDAVILRVYDRMMTTFEAETRAWQSPDFVEVAYNDLDKHPLDTLAKIYDTLELPGFQDAEPIFAGYLDRVKSYRKNVFRGDAEMVEKVSRHWSHWIERWDYSTPDLSSL